MEAERKAQEEREQEVAAERQRAKELAEAKAQKDEELRQKEAEKKKAEDARAKQLAEEKRAKEEAEAARIATEKQREKEQQEAEAAKAAALVEEEKRIQKAAEAAEQVRKAEEKKAREEAEAVRLVAEMKAREEEAAKRKEEKRKQEEAETLKRQEAARKEEEARLAAQQREIERLKREKAEILARKAAEKEEQRKAEEELELEQKRVEAERLKALEDAKKAAEILSLAENEALAEKRRIAEEKRKKQAMFLDDVDTFSTDFVSKTEQAAEQRRQKTAQSEEVLSDHISKASAGYVAPVAIGVAAAAINEEIVIEKPQDILPTKSAATSETDVTISWKREPPTGEDAKFEEVSSSFFSGSTNEETNLEPTTDFNEELRVPTRIGSKKLSGKKSNSQNTKAENTKDEDLVEEGYADDLNSLSNILTLEERKTMSTAQLESWRAKQTDLNSKRKGKFNSYSFSISLLACFPSEENNTIHLFVQDFHGAVTYFFGGIFSWQMYGSAEASDENGNPYTVINLMLKNHFYFTIILLQYLCDCILIRFLLQEYLMRCQWGTSFENMQPWIIAHRYKEFDMLDLIVSCFVLIVDLSILYNHQHVAIH